MKRVVCRNSQCSLNGKLTTYYFLRDSEMRIHEARGEDL